MEQIQLKESSLLVFNNNQFGELRTCGNFENPLFCLVDVCRILEISDHKQVRDRLNDNGITLVQTMTKNRGEQSLLFINEPNFYKCIFQSRKEEAVVFQNWIFEEVIPEIRKTGGYGKQMSKAEMRLMVFMDMQSEIDRQSNVIKKQGKRITALLGKLESEALARQQKKLAATRTRDERIMEKVRMMLEASPIIEDTSLCDLHKQFLALFAYDEDFDISNKVLSAVLRKMDYTPIKKRTGLYFKPCHENC